MPRAQELSSWFVSEGTQSDCDRFSRDTYETYAFSALVGGGADVHLAECINTVSSGICCRFVDIVADYCLQGGAFATPRGHIAILALLLRAQMLLRPA